jgi:hypothetical protein
VDDPLEPKPRGPTSALPVRKKKRHLSESDSGSFELLASRPPRPPANSKTPTPTPADKAESGQVQRGGRHKHHQVKRPVLGSIRFTKLCPFTPLLQDESASPCYVSPSSSSSSDDAADLFALLATEDLAVASAKLKRRRNHLVIILASSGSRETVSAHALVMMIVYFLRSYRAYSPVDDVVILSERADELSALSSDISQSIPDIFDMHVSYYMVQTFRLFSWCVYIYIYI